MEIQVVHTGNFDLGILEDINQLVINEKAEVTFWQKGKKTCEINFPVKNFSNRPDFKLIVPQDE